MRRVFRIVIIPLAAAGLIAGTTLPVMAAASVATPAVHAVHLADGGGDVYMHT